MRGLTLWQPWAFALLRLGKDVENRPWPWPRTLPTGGVRIALHAGARKVDVETASTFMQVCREVGLSPRDLVDRGLDGWSTLPYGAIVGLATLYPDGRRDSPWCMGQRGAFRVADVVELDAPIPWRGMLGLWRVPPELQALLCRAAGADPDEMVGADADELVGEEAP